MPFADRLQRVVTGRIAFGKYDGKRIGGKGRVQIYGNGILDTGASHQPWIIGRTGLVSSPVCFGGNTAYIVVVSIHPLEVHHRLRIIILQ